MTSVTVTQGSAPSLSVSVNANNQITGAPFSYDAAGNLLTDMLNTYTWSAEGKMATLSNAQGSVACTYDGDGKRVQKSSGKLYWYGTDGGVLAESDLSGNITDEYIFFGGVRLLKMKPAYSAFVSVTNLTLSRKEMTPLPQRVSNH